jgi:hypothetical protein
MCSLPAVALPLKLGADLTSYSAAQLMAALSLHQMWPFYLLYGGFGLLLGAWYSTQGEER